jgi:hypothetical protein
MKKNIFKKLLVGMIGPKTWSHSDKLRLEIFITLLTNIEILPNKYIAKYSKLNY